MGEFLLFWMDNPPDPDIEFLRWQGFREVMANWVLGAVLVATAIILCCYIIHVSRRMIRTASDLFAAYTPMYWLCLAILPGIVVFAIYARDYSKIFSGSPISYMSGAVVVALWTTFLTLFVAYLLMLLPGVTPAKFRYRPYWLFYRSKGARVD